MAILTIAERRVTELEEALRAGLRARTRLATVVRELADIEAALDQACEAIYNATLYDPAGERDDYVVTVDA